MIEYSNPEVETEVQAKKGGRLVDLPGMLKMLQFSGVLGHTAVGEELVDLEA